MNTLFLLTIKSLSSLLGDFFRDFWPGFLALETTGRTDGTDGTDGRTGRTGRTDRNTVLEYCWHGEIQFYSTTGTEKYSVQS